MSLFTFDSSSSTHVEEVEEEVYVVSCQMT